MIDSCLSSSLDLNV